MQGGRLLRVQGSAARPDLVLLDAVRAARGRLRMRVAELERARRADRLTFLASGMLLADVTALDAVPRESVRRESVRRIG